MTEQLTPEKKTPEKKAPKRAASKNSEKKPKIGFFKWLVLLVMLASIGGVGYVAWMYTQELKTDMQQQLDGMAQNNQQAQNQINQIVGKLNEANNQVLNLEQQLKNQQLTLTQAQQQWLATAKYFSQNQTADPLKWQLAEAEYLMRLAMQRIRIEKDSQGSLEILLTVDKLLLETGSPVVFDVRNQLAQDMVALAQIKPVDIEGSFLKIQAIIAQVSEWQYQQPRIKEMESDKTPEHILDRLKHYIKVEKIGEHTEIALSETRFYSAKQELRLLLQQSQNALLMADQALFDLTLKQTNELLVRYFPVLSKDVLPVVDTFNAIELSQNLPDISKSAVELQQLVAQLLQIPEAVETLKNQAGDNVEQTDTMEPSNPETEDSQPAVIEEAS